ncbi:LOW QUALITY PROTEIN: KH domain-containing protein HEN4-like [Primulina tabacum]|uniref:LOW QUALITY PROTEIN: KH domain-containing protein HEN4-like n=1 Tax=Primulina tabacum TaxID=48773 RepID=UPI003F5A8FA7
MESSFHFPPAKRHVHAPSTTMDEAHQNHNSTTHFNQSLDGGASLSSRSKPHQSPLYVPPGHVAFRVVCPASCVGGLIGKSGSIVKNLQQLTNSKIRVQEHKNLSEHRVITVSSSPLATNRITLHGDEWLEVSAAQEGVVRVFERVVEVAIEVDSLAVAGAVEGNVLCRLLVWKNQAGTVIGIRGKVVDEIRDDSGSRIKLLKPEEFPSFALPTDAIVEIEGDVLAVKKTLVAVTSRLQEFPSFERTTMHGARPFEVESSSIPPMGLPRQQNPMLQFMPSNSIKQTLRDDTLLSAPEKISTVDSMTLQQEVVFKMLCPKYQVGAIIGKKGSVVRALESESGASIRVGRALAESDEIVIIISAVENVERQYSPAQKAAILVFNRCMEVRVQKGRDLDSKRSAVSARLLVPANQIFCLLGERGAIISEMRKVTGAGIWIIGGNQVPKCGSENDEVVQITGEFLGVQDALSKVTARLRDNILSAKPSIGSGTIQKNPYLRVRDHLPFGLYPSFVTPDNLNEHKSLPQSIDKRPSYDIDRLLSPSLLASLKISGEDLGRGMEMDRKMHSIQGVVELGSGRGSEIVANTTVEIVVPAYAIGSVYGENGSNLDRLRQISGAKIVILEPQPGATDRIVSISGTPDETLSAQSLLQAFI